MKRRGNANNGKLIYLALPDFEGETRLIDKGGVSQFSYRSNAKSARRMPQLDRAITIDGEPWALISEKPSGLNPGFRIVTVRKGQ